MTNQSNLKKIAIISILIVITITITTITLQLTQQSQDTRSRASQPSENLNKNIIKDACIHDNTGNIVCPQYHSPSPDFCRDGTLISRGIDQCGCQLPPTCLPHLCWNQVIPCNDSFCWPNGCQGDPNATACTMQLVSLSQEQLDQYQLWREAGSPTYSGCQSTSSNPPNCANHDTPIIKKGTAPFETYLAGGGSSSGGPNDSGINSQGFHWDFNGDGVWDLTNGTSLQAHTYTTPGTYYPKYAVSDTEGNLSTTCDPKITVTVLPDDSANQNFSPFDLNQDNTINLLDYNLFLNGWLDTLK